MTDGGNACKHSFKTTSETLEWIRARIDFLKPYRLWEAVDEEWMYCLRREPVENLLGIPSGVVQDRLWEAVDEEWMYCLGREPVENLLRIPSGVVQDHWPALLKEYVLTLKSLSLPRDQGDLQEAFPGLRPASLNNVISQGMNQKKKHEIEVLAAVIASIARRVGGNTIMDVGSGQGYLAQVLSFEHGLSVIAIDASSHHGSITDARAKRIEKYYAAKTCKSRSENKGFSIPRTVTCRVLSPAMLKDVSGSLLQVKDLEKPTFIGKKVDGKPLEETVGSESPSPLKENGKSSLVLAGLHACGDLSVTMLRTFMECDDVKAVISIGCCYNLLSEEGVEEVNSQCGFPVSKGAKSASLLLGKNARDLACQSAERWRGLGEAAGLHNFELHAFRAAFQMVYTVAHSSSFPGCLSVLSQHHPEITMRNPSIGRQGKAVRRQHHRRILESNANVPEASSQNNCSAQTTYPLLTEHSAYPNSSKEESKSINRYPMFVKFCKSGLARLGLHDLQDIEFSRVWNEAQEFSIQNENRQLNRKHSYLGNYMDIGSFKLIELVRVPRGLLWMTIALQELVGPYWTLRAALGPVLETLMLLDRLLFLQEQGNVLRQAIMVPLFDPVLSPRNVALIAEKF
ncbi:hypothetical protein BUALT_Bualt03G0164800 [Buddleja alternifolia]|uniref:Methyltransferase domain-containing protein n=1 Tax=Buddleja alternifolia TaxID=168488 RepID=A0AAV6Y2S0_9LAMI|nr:hypothetical protein BUALT_Bualt03G0164800 [Buddleja alternifolia]